MHYVEDHEPLSERNQAHGFGEGVDGKASALDTAHTGIGYKIKREKAIKERERKV
jgi:hypothetical protein